MRIERGEIGRANEKEMVGRAIRRQPKRWSENKEIKDGCGQSCIQNGKLTFCSLCEHVSLETWGVGSGYSTKLSFKIHCLFWSTSDGCKFVPTCLYFLCFLFLFVFVVLKIYSVYHKTMSGLLPDTIDDECFCFLFFFK